MGLELDVERDVGPCSPLQRDSSTGAAPSSWLEFAKEVVLLLSSEELPGVESIPAAYLEMIKASFFW